MKKLNKAILLALGMSLSFTVMASPDDEVTIRVMEMNENSNEHVMRDIELPEAASDKAREHAEDGLATANERRDRNREREHDGDDDNDDNDADHEREGEMEHEQEQEHEMEQEHEVELEEFVQPFDTIVVPQSYF